MESHIISVNSSIIMKVIIIEQYTSKIYNHHFIAFLQWFMKCDLILNFNVIEIYVVFIFYSFLVIFYLIMVNIMISLSCYILEISIKIIFKMKVKLLELLFIYFTF